MDGRVRLSGCAPLARGLVISGHASRGWDWHDPRWLHAHRCTDVLCAIIDRTKTDGPTDYDAVHKIQAGYKITRLSEWGKEPVPPVVKIDPSIDMETPSKKTVAHYAGRKVFCLCG